MILLEAISIRSNHELRQDLQRQDKRNEQKQHSAQSNIHPRNRTSAKKKKKRILRDKKHLETAAEKSKERAQDDPGKKTLECNQRTQGGK